MNKAPLIKEWAKINLTGNNFTSPIGLIHVTMKGIKEAINQPQKLNRRKIMRSILCQIY